MTLQDRINIISELGLYLRKNFLEDHFDSIKIATVKNPWFTVKSITNAVLSISDMVEKDMLNAWLNPYTIKEPSSSKNVLIIMAGNIPLVGFHDLLSVIIMGHNPVIKLSSNDNVLMPLIINIFLDLFEYREFIFSSVKTEFYSKYKRSKFGQQSTNTTRFN